MSIARNGYYAVASSHDKAEDLPLPNGRKYATKKRSLSRVVVVLGAIICICVVSLALKVWSLQTPWSSRHLPVVLLEDSLVGVQPLQEAEMYQSDHFIHRCGMVSLVSGFSMDICEDDYLKSPFEVAFRAGYGMDIDMQRVRTAGSDVNRSKQVANADYDGEILADTAERNITLGRIPHSLVQTNKNIEQIFRSCSEVNADYDSRFLNDEDIDTMVKTYMSEEVYQAFSSLPLPILKSDFFRYITLYIFGGAYMDADVKCVRKLDTLIDTKGVEFIAGVENNLLNVDNWFDWNFPRRFQFLQWGLISSPRHPIMRDTIRKIVAMSKRMNVALPLMTGNDKKMGILGYTGPGVYTDSVLDYISYRPTLTFSDVFSSHPELYGTESEFNNTIRDTETIIKVIKLMQAKMGNPEDITLKTSTRFDNLTNEHLVENAKTMLQNNALELEDAKEMLSALMSRHDTQSSTLLRISMIQLGMVSYDLRDLLLGAGADPQNPDMGIAVGLTEAEISQNTGVLMRGVRVVPRIFLSPTMHGPSEEEFDDRAYIVHTQQGSWLGGL